MNPTMMSYKGFKAQIMEAERLTGDYVHELPPGRALPAYPVDMLLEPPESWMKGPGAFVVPVKPNKGLWFNWTQNSDNNTAVIPTVKGCNPITGMPTSGFHMERYENKCPKHGCDFLHDRFCPECNYKWPPQNFVGPKNNLWWDGFLNVNDGTVRQFFFSKEELRDVASGLIGKKNTVPAFGFAFYAPKERRSEPAGIYRNGKIYNYADGKYMMLKDCGVTDFGFNGSLGTNQAYYSSNSSSESSGTSLCCDSADVVETSGEVKTSGGIICSGLNLGSSKVLGMCVDKEMSKEAERSSAGPAASLGNVGILGKRSRGFSKSLSPSETRCRADLRCAGMDEVRGLTIGASMDEGIERERGYDYKQERLMPAPIKEVSIGAGARINQSLNADPFGLDTWKEAPDSVMTIYFVFQEKFEELKAKGVRDLGGVKEGMLASLLVG